MKRLLVFLLCASVVFLSCKDNQLGSALASAEISMNDNPEASLEVLESIDKDLLSTRKQKAKYALLYSMALDKNYIDIKADSIIAPAVKYYECHGSIDDKIKSLYYYARVQYNSGEYNPAIVTLMKTIPLFDNSSEVRYLALVHNMLAVLYNESGLFEESFEHLSIAYDSAIKCNDYKLADLILRRKGVYYSNIKDYDKAEEIFEQVLSNDRIGSVRSEVMCDYALVLLLRDDKQYESAVNLYRQALEISPYFYSANHWGAFAYALCMIGESDYSEQIFSQLYAQYNDAYCKAIYESWMQFVYFNSGNYKDAYLSLNKILPYQDSLYRDKLRNSAVKAQRDYWAYKNAETEIEKRHKNIVLSLIIALLALLSLLLHYLYKKTIEKAIAEKESLFQISETVRRQLILVEEERKEAEHYLRTIVNSKDQEIDILRSHIDEKDKKLAVLRSEHAQMYKSQFKTLGDLCETFIRSKEQRDSHRMVYEKVKDMLKEINGDKAAHMRFERMINKTLNNIMKHFRDDFPNYTENDYRFISYVFVGFDATTLSIIFDMPSQASVYMKKSRIKKNIQSTTSEFKGLYLEMIE